MKEFIHGWRRKLGGIALVIGCLFMGLWGRSWCYQDEVRFSRDSHYVSLVSNRERLIWGRGSSWSDDAEAQFRKKPFHIDWEIGMAPTELAEMFTAELEFPDENRFRCFGLDFGFVRGRIAANYGWTESLYAVPYAYIVIPLTLLSAYLILWKPRKPAK